MTPACSTVTEEQETASMTEPKYETAYELGQRIGHTDSVVCTDCGVFVMDVAAHTRFHSILSSHAWARAAGTTSSSTTT